MAGGRFLHDKAESIEHGRKQHEIGAAIISAQDLSVAHEARKYDLIADAELFGELFVLLKLVPAADHEKLASMSAPFEFGYHLEREL